MSDISKIIDRPITIHIAAELGAGKSTFINLLQAYEKWLIEEEIIDNKFIFPFIEDTLEHSANEIWDQYQTIITGDTPDPVVYTVQSWFMNQKLGLLYQAAGEDYPGAPGFFHVVDTGEDETGDFGWPSRFFNYNYDSNDPRPPGLYIVERLPRADMMVFASRYKDLFVLGTSQVPGSFERYKWHYKRYVDKAPLPDLYIRLKATPSVSMERVGKRKTGEKLKLEDYEQIHAAYTLFVDPWIKETGVPLIEINTALPELDYTTPDGQNHFLTKFVRKMNKLGFWNTPYIVLPHYPLLEIS
jgi:deoxyadenosine/deoxycytidine kinase